MVTIPMEWALWSKRPGARDDNGVLACSDGRLRASHFQGIIRRSSPGTPEEDRHLPRVVFSTFRIEGHRCIGVGVQEWSDEHDGTGRRIAPTRFFVFRYEDLHGHPVSYEGLYEALSQVRLPAAGGSPLDVEVPRLDPERIATFLTTDTQTSSALTAACCLLYRWRVCVTRAENAAPRDRLRYLDAAVALLPYGYRTNISATTWANSATRHPLRLSFARLATGGEDVRELRWKTRARVPTSSYTNLLRSLLDKAPVTALLADLAGETEAVALGDHAGAHAVLERISTHRRRRRAADEGVHTPADAREWLDDEGLEAPLAVAALRRLLPHAQAGDVSRVVRGLRRVPDSELDEWRAPLDETAARLLWREGAGLTGLLQAIPEAWADSFLAGLVRSRPADPGAAEQGLEPMAQLLIERAVAAPGRYPLTAEALDRAVPLALRLVSALVAEEEPPWNELEWVSGLLTSDVLTALHRLVGWDDEPLRTADVTVLAGHGDGCVLTALDIACSRGRLHLVADAFVQWLLGRGGIRPEERTSWGNRLSQLQTDDPGMQALIDVVLLTTDRQCVWMMNVPNDEWDRYAAAFQRYWSRGWAEPNVMFFALDRWLGAMRWGPEVRGRADQVLALLPGLVLPDGLSLDAALVNSLSQARDLSQDPHAARWLDDRGAPYTPPAPPPAPPPELPPPTPPAPAEDAGRSPEYRRVERNDAESILAYIETSMINGKPPGEVYRWLSEKMTITRADVAHDVAERIPRRLADHLSLGQAREWQHRFVEHLCWRQADDAFVKDFLDLYVRNRLNVIGSFVEDLETVHGRSDVLRTRGQQIRDIAHALEALIVDPEATRGRGWLPLGKNKNRAADPPPADPPSADAPEDPAR
ncbi:MAG TPA: hypothetical protein VHJ17_16845 [Thermomonospora sp.]|nr:hypothetical protein [Thermomonospora sp.]